MHNQRTSDDEESKGLMIAAFNSTLPSSVSVANVGASSKPPISSSPPRVATFTSALPAASSVSVADVGARGEPSGFSSSSTVATFISSLEAASSVSVASVESSVFSSSSTVEAASSVVGSNVGTSGNEESEDVVVTGAEAVCRRIN